MKNEGHPITGQSHRLAALFAVLIGTAMGFSFPVPLCAQVGDGGSGEPVESEPVEDPAGDAFRQKIGEAEEKYLAALERLDAEALAGYEALKIRYGKSGNLDGAIWAANRIAKLKGEPPIGGGNPAAQPKSDPVDEKWRQGRKRFGEIFVAEAQRIYGVEVSRLQEETKRLTIAGLLDEAQAMDSAAKRLAAQIPKKPPVSAPKIRRHTPDEILDHVFTYGGGHYYQFPEPMNYADAAAACRGIGGDLLSIRSEEKYDHFHRYSVENKKPLWTDLNDEGEDLDWRHADGEKAEFLKWQSGEPNGGDSQKHVMIGHNGSWDMRDVNPDDRFFVICEW